MALGAVLAAALTDHSARTMTLTVGGIDLLLGPGTPGQRAGIPIDSVYWTERGPGDCSELSFTIEDPAGNVAVAAGSFVQFRDVTADVTLFSGFPAKVSRRPWAPIGRYIDVSCVGLEKVLDWAKLPAITLAAGMNSQAAIQSLVAQVTGLAYPLRAFADNSDEGVFARPIGTLAGGTLGDTALTIGAGTTLREGIRAILDDTIHVDDDGVVGGLCTVDAYAGLRVYPERMILGGLTPYLLLRPGDWTRLLVHTDTPTPPGFAPVEKLDYADDYIGAPAMVMVIGAGGAITTVGTGAPTGDCAVLSDSTLDTDARRRAAGYSYLLQTVGEATARGKAEVDYGVVIPTTTHAGSVLEIYDPVLGLDADFRVTEMARTYRAGGTQSRLSFAFGGSAPSLATLVRRLTRLVPN